MGLVIFLLEIIGFGIGIPIGILLGFFLFIYSEPQDIENPITRPLQEFDSTSLLDLWFEIPLWIKYPDYERVDWMNKFIHDTWPYIDKVTCGIIIDITKPVFSDYIGKFQIRSIYFDRLSLGTLPPLIHGIKICESTDSQIIFEPAVRWAGNPHIVLVLKLLFVQIRIELIDLQISAAPRIILKPLVPSFPCFASIVVSLMEKPRLDFGIKVMGGDVMAIPGLYHFIQETIGNQISSLFLWPETLEIPILDSSVGAVKKPVGILHVKVVRACKLLKMDLLGRSDPYVKLSLTGERLPAKKSSVKMNNLNPIWNEDFKLIVKDPLSQSLQLHLYDWEKVGKHDKLGMQVVPLKELEPYEKKEYVLDLLKNMNPNDPHNQKPRGKVIVEMTFIPFREENAISNRSSEICSTNEIVETVSEDTSLCRAGLLLVTVIGAVAVEGKHHNNPYVLILFKGEQKKTKVMKKTRDPRWNEEFQFMLEETPLNDKIHIEVMSKRKSFSFWPKESLGQVDINLIDVVSNGHINEMYHLINSRNGLIHIDMRWSMI